jgi:hypothetical protein
MCFHPKFQDLIGHGLPRLDSAHFYPSTLSSRNESKSHWLSDLNFSTRQNTDPIRDLSFRTKGRLGV